jgi:cation transport ATPase
MTRGNCALTVATYLTKHGTSNAVADASTGDLTFDIVGDGSNDSQVLLLKNKLSMLPKAIELGKQTYLTIKQNLFGAFFIILSLFRLEPRAI